MTTRNKTGQKPWTITPPAEAIAPRGPKRSLDDAMARLGPFQHATAEEAERYADRDVRIPPSEELAFASIMALVEQFNSREYLDVGAPRAKHVLDKLARLEQLTGELARVDFDR